MNRPSGRLVPAEVTADSLPGRRLDALWLPGMQFCPRRSHQVSIREQGIDSRKVRWVLSTHEAAIASPVAVDIAQLIRHVDVPARERQPEPEEL